jgi:SPP1 gp7 family putative phage head morphogenesis protein
MLTLKDNYWYPIQGEINAYFYQLFFADIFANFDKKELRNDRITVLIDALRQGTVFYSNGEFSGNFNAKISKELSKFAIFDGRKKVWRGVAPAQVARVAVQVESRNKAIHAQIVKAIKDIPKRVKEELDKLQFSIDDSLAKMNYDIQNDYAHLGVMPEMPQKMHDKLLQEYTKNQQLNIKNWSVDQVERLRRVVEEDIKNGYNRRKLIDMLVNEWGTTQNKAKFLARQETSLFMSKFRRERFLGAGVTKYRWSSSHDERTRPLHKLLNGKTFFFGSPPVSGTDGEREEPGEPFGCRCVAVPLLD